MSTRASVGDSTALDSRPDQKVESPRMWQVLLHNDDYTTQEFVVWLLERVFHKPRPEAFSIMMNVHRSGMGVAGIYTRDVADTKAKAAQEAAEEHEFPLLVTLEPVPDP